VSLELRVHLARGQADTAQLCPRDDRELPLGESS
jgi:hypothetical protein